MAKDKMSSTYKGFFDLEELTVTEYDKKSETETLHELKKQLLKYNGLDNVSISISYDSEINPE